jgi:hypothetical protein
VKSPIGITTDRQAMGRSEPYERLRMSDYIDSDRGL